MAMVPMTAMPQRTALSHAFGALAASMVGVAEFLIHRTAEGSNMGPVKMGALGFEVMLGSLTTTGSLIAASKLQELMRGTPIQFKGQHIVNLMLAVTMVGCYIGWLTHPGMAAMFCGMVGSARWLGVMLVIPEGAADVAGVLYRVDS